MYVEENFEKGISAWKRILIFIIDGCLALIIFLALLYTAGNASVKAINHNEINTINLVYEEVCKEKSIPYKVESVYGFYQIDQNSIINQKVEEGLDVEKAYSYYEEVNTWVNKEIQGYDEYIQAYKRFYSSYIVCNVVCMLIPLFVFELIIPLLTRKHQTIGMMCFSLGIVYKKDNISVKNYTVLFRFLFIFFVEYLIPYILLKLIGLVFVILLTFLSISFTKSKATFHDGILKLKLASRDKIFTNDVD